MIFGCGVTWNILFIENILWHWRIWKTISVCLWEASGSTSYDLHLNKRSTDCRFSILMKENRIERFPCIDKFIKMWVYGTFELYILRILCLFSIFFCYIAPYIFVPVTHVLHSLDRCTESSEWSNFNTYHLVYKDDKTEE